MRARRGILLLAVVVLGAALVAVEHRPARAADPPLAAPPLRRPATGYWMVAADGGVFAFGDAGFHGSTGGVRLVAPMVGMATSPSGRGYWLVARDGGVFAFGDAGFHGSTGGLPLNQPIVGITATPTGRGYWLAARDGGVFAFGDAAFHGSTGGMALNQPIVKMVATPTGAGYWLVASDGGIFTFGDAAFHGSTGSMKLNAPIVTMAPTLDGDGYWLVASDGGIFTFGRARFHGSTGSLKLNRPIVGMSTTGFDDGYWLVASDGGVFSFGDARFYGSTGGIALASPVVGMAARPRPATVETAAFYYPWWGTEADDGDWRHWDDANVAAKPRAYDPPAELASSFYPHRGPYSSSRDDVLAAQMAEMAGAGIRVVVISWWGPRSFEDAVLGRVVAAARAAGLRPAVHVEPYSGRTPDTVSHEVARMSASFGIDEYWIYVSDGPAPGAWRSVTDRFPAFRIWAHSHRASNAIGSLFATYAATAGFDGVYTYDPLPYSPESFSRVCDQARARGLLCSPSVNPGYDDRRIRSSATSAVRGREGGARYDRYWRAAFSAGADVVSITSYNEWHEGTQIEPARFACFPTVGCYESYDGSYGKLGDAAAGAYLARTREWVDELARSSG